MMQWLKWLVASAELLELERWRVEWQEHRRWLAEFKDVGTALDRMKAVVNGEPVVWIWDLRESMRAENSPAGGDVVVTADRSGAVVMVSRQDDDGRILSVIWESEAPYGAHGEARESVLPKRDATKPAEEQGLFRKFVVQRVDGSDQPGGKHFGCNYFVLDTDHDPHAAAALRAYAVDCSDSHPQLAADLAARFGAHPSEGLAADLRPMQKGSA